MAIFQWMTLPFVNLRILVAENDSVSQKLMARTLERWL